MTISFNKKENRGSRKNSSFFSGMATKSTEGTEKSVVLRGLNKG